MTELRIETVNVNSLTPDPANARKHDGKNLQAIAHSLEKFGQRKPICVTPDSIVVAGNGTLEAAKSLGWTEIVIARTPVGWTWEQIRAFALADNRTAELAEWDDKVLADQLLELDANGWELEELGFKNLEPPVGQEHDEEPLSFDDAPTRAKLGDIWKLGNHKVLCGDSSDTNALDRLMQGKKAELVLTDPPYRYKTMVGGGAATFSEGYAKLKEDLKDIIDFDPKQFLQVLPTVFDKNINAYIFCNTDLVPDYCNWARENNYNFNILTWHKTSFIPANYGHHFPDTEYLIYISKSAIFNSGLGLNYGKYFVLDNEKHSDHPTIKPLEILKTEIKISSNRGGLVVDFFGGSGSTLLACEQTERICHTIELEPRYVDVILKRWESYTGKTAELLGQ
jgi:site-specific DNA-methyltransferase (adenine-specific)